MSKVEFKTGQQVIVRMSDRDEWSFDFFSHYEKGADDPYVCTGNCHYAFCLPFDPETAHLVGTSATPVVDESTRFECGQWVEIDTIGEGRRKAIYLKYGEDAGAERHLIYEPEIRETTYWVESHKIYEIEG